MELTDPPPLDDTDRSHLIDAVPATVDGRAVIVAVDERGPIEVFDAADGRPVNEPIGERSTRYRTVGGHPRLATVTAGGRELLVVMSQLAPLTVDPATGATRSTPEPPPATSVLSAMATHNGLIAAINLGGVLAVWDAATLALRASARVAQTLEATSIAWGDRHGRSVILVGTDGGAIRWFDSADLTGIAPPGRPAERTGTAGHTVDASNWPAPGAVTQLRVTDRTVFSAAGPTVTGLDIETGEPAGPALVHPGTVRAVSPTVLDGVPVIATSCDDRTLRVWETTTGRTLRTITLPRVIHRIIRVTSRQITVLDSGYLLAIANSA